MKYCNRKSCSKAHDTKFKLCPCCREKHATYTRNRRKRRLEAKCPKGFRVCIDCARQKPEDHFESPVYRRSQLTTRCKSCRELRSKNDKNHTSKNGMCYNFWLNWRKTHDCLDCGLSDYRVIQADHISKKKNLVSDYRYWAHNGGVEAQKKEALMCQPRCACCHRLKTKERLDKKRKNKIKPCRIRRRKLVDGKKLEIGKCQHCNRMVETNTTCAFDFDHRDEEGKVISISVSIFKNEKAFQHHYREEIPKCQLLCANCHHIKSHYTKKMKL